MQHRIVILGPGYAGAIAAGRLARRLRGDAQITLVNAEPDFVERIRMHQLATGQDLPTRPLSEALAGTGATLRVARVTGVDVDRKLVTVADADGTDELGSDTLVDALRSSVAHHRVPGVAEHAHEVASRPGALRLRARLQELEAGARVVVVGGGLTGIEAATEIAESHEQLEVALVARRGFGDWLSPRGQRHLRKVFGRLGITVHEEVDVARVDATDLVTTDGARIPTDVTVWTAGFAAHPLASATSLTVSESGRIVVDETMRSVSHPEVYAVGDAALAPGPGAEPLRMSCAAGTPMAWQAADAIVARLTGGELPNMPLRFYGQCISLGRRDGLVQFVTADDRAKPSVLRGRFAARVKELVCRGAAYGVFHPTMYPARRRGRSSVPDRVTAAA